MLKKTVLTKYESNCNDNVRKLVHDFKYYEGRSKFYYDCWLLIIKMLCVTTAFIYH